ncbi:MAG: phosphate transport system substrate-binding protein [Alphaproteobacteria bacterium]|jgi:phosphate transport system substrate-binding protein
MMKKTLALAAVAMIGLAGAAQARDQIRIVGSSTVFPFATKVVEEFGKTTRYKTPVIESTGSGGGIKLFCSGVGVGTPDITNSSRRIKASEVKKCAQNGVAAITEVKIGFDGIVLANSKKSPVFKLTRKEIFMALAKEVPMGDKMVKNPYSNWKQINASLPDIKIEVLGPPPTSGTRDAFVELVMEKGGSKFKEINAIKKNGKMFKNATHSIREDGAFIEAGENDNLIVQKLEANPNAIGIFGFSFLDQNKDKIHGSIVEGNAPTFENIAGGKYTISRSLYFYVKNAHVGKIPGIDAYVREFTSEKAWGELGYLVEKGLIPLPQMERGAVSKSARALKPLSM